MAATDGPLKRLVTICIVDFARWLLDSEVLDAYSLNIELPVQEVARTDLLFRVVLPDGPATMLHIEFQGKSSHAPMRWRMLDYMVRLANVERDLTLYSVVFYVGQGAGAKDEGVYSVPSPDGTASLQWRYHVVRLWEMDAQALLDSGQLALLPLVGQTRMENPKVIVPQIFQRLQSVENEELQER